MSEPKQGGFSNKLWNNKIIQDYISEGGIFGYVGDSARRTKFDKMLEKEFKLHKRKNTSIAKFVISSDGRHFMDGVHPEDSPEGFREKLKRFMKW